MRLLWKVLLLSNQEFGFMTKLLKLNIYKLQNILAVLGFLIIFWDLYILFYDLCYVNDGSEIMTEFISQRC